MKILRALVVAAVVLSNLAVATPSVMDSAISPNPSRATYDDVLKFMKDLAAKYPSTTQMFVLGDSDSGRKIEGLQIGNGPVKSLVVASHHGNEYASVETARGVAASLAEHPIKDHTVFVIPVLNISGYNAKNRYEIVRGRRYDPNRNYPGPCGTEGPFTLKSTQALAKFVEEQGIVASATLHTFTPAVVYPWGISTHDLSTPYDDLFKSLVEAATIESHYKHGNSTDLIYAADGTYEDYAFWKHGVWSLLYELGYSHTPNNDDVKETVSVNVPGIRRALEASPSQRAQDHDFKGKCDRKVKLRGLE